MIIFENHPANYVFISLYRTGPCGRMVEYSTNIMIITFTQSREVRAVVHYAAHVG